MLEEEAKKRQATHKKGDVYLVEKIPQAEGKSAVQAGKQVDVSEKYVREAFGVCY